MINEKPRGPFLRAAPVAVGAILLIGSALLAVSILLAMFPLSSGAAVLSVPGRVLYSVYGISSFLVPCFFLFAVVLIVIPGWTPRSGVILAGSFVPFFTVVGGERLYRASDLAGSVSPLAPGITIGLVVTIILAVLIEYLLLLFLSDLVFPLARTITAESDDYASEAEGAVHDDYVPDVEGLAPAGIDGSASFVEPIEPVDQAAQTPEDRLEYEAWVNSPDDPAQAMADEPTVGVDDAKGVKSAEAGDALEELDELDVVEDDGDIENAAYADEAEDAIVDLDEIDDLVDIDDAGEVCDVDAEDEADAADALDEAEILDEADAADEADPLEGVVIYQPEQAVTAGSRDAAPAGTRSHTPATSRKFVSYGVPYDVLNAYPDGEYWIIDEATRRSAAALKETLNEFNIQADVTGIRKGPVITMFEILPAPGVKLSKIVSLQDNIALRLAASSVRIVAPIPGKHAVGIEVPNQKRAIVSFREIIEHDSPAVKKMEIPVILGKDITGEAQLLDLAQTPHLLIAGSTGSGKSVCVNAIILSILYKRSPEDVRLILIDPKIVELKLYNDIGHLLSPVITEPKRAFQSLQYCLCEMERRYALLDGMGVRDIKSYNHRIKERKIATEKLPYIVVIIDEFADLMATTGKELESTVARLCAMSRAVGIHMVLATQRPSIDVITGLIKANIPTRIAFMVASKMDSRIIIDQVGAEKLLGRGDMLYSSATDPFPVRIQGAYVSEEEVERVVEHVKKLGAPEYIDEEMFVDDDEDGSIDASLFGDGEDPLYDKALEIVMLAGKASASYIQRKLKIGYNRAARLVEDMEARGIVGPANGSKPREVIHHV